MSVLLSFYTVWFLTWTDKRQYISYTNAKEKKYHELVRSPLISSVLLNKESRKGDDETLRQGQDTQAKVREIKYLRGFQNNGKKFISAKGLTNTKTSIQLTSSCFQCDTPLKIPLPQCICTFTTHRKCVRKQSIFRCILMQFCSVTICSSYNSRRAVMFGDLSGSLRLPHQPTTDKKRQQHWNLWIKHLHHHMVKIY